MADPTLGATPLLPPSPRLGTTAPLAPPAFVPPPPPPPPTLNDTTTVAPGATGARRSGLALGGATAPLAGGAAPAAPTLLKLGASGQDVTDLQTLLKASNPTLVVSGKYDAATKAAVTAYQKANGLKVDGLAGPETRGALDLNKQLDNAMTQKIMQASPDPAVQAQCEAAIKASIAQAKQDLAGFRPESAAARDKAAQQIATLEAALAPHAVAPASGSAVAGGSSNPGGSAAGPDPEATAIAAGPIGASVARDLANAAGSHFLFGSVNNDVRQGLLDAKTPAEFEQVAQAARAHDETKAHADTIHAIATAQTPSVRNALRDAYAHVDQPDVMNQKLTEALSAPNQSLADKAAVRAVVDRLHTEGKTELTGKDVMQAYARPQAPAGGSPGPLPDPGATAIAAGQVTGAVAKDLGNAAGFHLFGSAYGDIRQGLKDAQTPADYEQVAQAASQHEATKAHADTIHAIGTAPTQGVRDALRDAYAAAGHPGQVNQRVLEAMGKAGQNPADRAAIKSVVDRLNAEGYVPYTGTSLLGQ